MVASVVSGGYADSDGANRVADLAVCCGENVRAPTTDTKVADVGRVGVSISQDRLNGLVDELS